MNDTLARVRRVLDVEGIDGALAFLNARVLHRFTAIFRLEGQTLRLIHFYDKAGGPPLEVARSVPLGMSLCQFALRDGSFITRDARSDGRTAASPMSTVMQSYVGLPLQGPAGQLIGTFCHFDPSNIDLPPGEFEFLHDAVKQLPGYLAA